MRTRIHSVGCIFNTETGNLMMLSLPIATRERSDLKTWLVNEVNQKVKQLFSNDLAKPVFARRVKEGKQDYLIGRYFC